MSPPPDHLFFIRFSQCAVFRTTVMVCPGGAYQILAIEHEGVDVCKWLNEVGVHAVLLKYRVPRRKNREPHAAPLIHAQGAYILSVRLVKTGSNDSLNLEFLDSLRGEPSHE